MYTWKYSDHIDYGLVVYECLIGYFVGERMCLGSFLTLPGVEVNWFLTGTGISLEKITCEFIYFLGSQAAVFFGLRSFERTRLENARRHSFWNTVIKLMAYLAVIQECW